MTRRPEDARPIADAAGEDDWIEHDGAGCPVDVDSYVDVRHADGTVSRMSPAGFWCAGLEPWVHSMCECEEIKIIAYRVVGAA
ncbi:hypothetical protein B5M44_04290 [Shinella sumterensis]|uniref:hypothetical protein n=1 Tax=Shinella sumterensis TaxID=1967501 RepID=UPI00106EAB0B|nr:hypothetical protein [Shinella sumterensis]MCD1264039.1 hypothetical protein [Shinella sumterensis]TFE99425.1 hypothetical protein B5M44_04290 [Shinella sumterensis]